MRRTFYVAKVKGRKRYAALGRETGMGREIIDVASIRTAQQAGSPAGLMYGFLGGHFTGYEAIKVQEVTSYKKTKVRWPDPEKVFDR